MLSKTSIPSEYYIEEEFFYPPPFLAYHKRSAWVAVAGTCVVILFILSISYIKTREDDRHFEYIHHMMQKGQLDKALAAFQTFETRYSHSNRLAEVKQLTQQIQQQLFTKQFSQALQEPTYHMQKEALHQLLKRYPTFHAVPDLRSRYQQLDHKLAVYTRRLNNAKAQIQQKFYTAALQELAPILQVGQPLGPIYEESLDLQRKSYIGKIRFYLIKGQLTAAYKAILEAEKAHVSDPLIVELKEKLQGLKKVAAH